MPQTSSSQNIFYFHLLHNIILFSLSFSFKILGSFFFVSARSILLLQGGKKNNHACVPIQILMFLSLSCFVLSPFSSHQHPRSRFPLSCVSIPVLFTSSGNCINMKALFYILHSYCPKEQQQNVDGSLFPIG